MDHDAMTMSHRLDPPRDLSHVRRDDCAWELSGGDVDRSPSSPMDFAVVRDLRGGKPR